MMAASSDSQAIVVKLTESDVPGACLNSKLKILHEAHVLLAEKAAGSDVKINYL